MVTAKNGVAAAQRRFKRKTLSRLALLVSAASFVAGPAGAQEVTPINPTPPQRIMDPNNVDLANGTVAISKTLISGGDPARPLAAVYSMSSGDGMGLGVLNLEPHSTWPFYEPYQYETVGTPIGNFVFRYFNVGPLPSVRWSIGPIVGGVDANGWFNANGDRFTPGLATYADGETWTYFYATAPYPGGGTISYVKFIVSNRGYGLQFSYNTTGAPGWSERITYYNKSYVYCDETQLVDCPAVSSLPTAGTVTPATALSGASYYVNVGPAGTGVDPVSYPAVGAATYAGPGESGITVYWGAGGDGVHSFGDILKIETAGVSSSARTYTYMHVPGNGEGSPGNSGLLSASDGSHTWTYLVPQDPVQPPTTPIFENGFTSKDPDGKEVYASSLSLIGAPGTIIDQLGRTSGFGYSSPDFRYAGSVTPENGVISYTTDSRGNITGERRIAKPGSGLADLVRSAGYDTTCSNVKTCNKPNWTTDFKGNQTDIVYNANNGAVATVTGPADPNGVRPQKRYTYVQRYALILNSSGGYVQASTPVWMLESESFCRNSAATGNPSAPCTGNDEVKTVYDYGPTSGAPNNLFLRGVAVTADGATLRTCYGNDRNGRRIWTTSPRANKTSCS